MNSEIVVAILSAVFVIVIYALIWWLSEISERNQQREYEKFINNLSKDMGATNKDVAKAKIELKKLCHQKREIEKQVFTEDEYNLYVTEQIIEKMCFSRLRKEYTDHSYFLYEKLLKDIYTLYSSYGLHYVLVNENIQPENLVNFS